MFTWKLERYARYINNNNGGTWQYFDDRQDDLVLTLTETAHLILCQGNVILESYSLNAAKAIMRGMAKSDSMLIMIKTKNETRRFRFKFYGTNEIKGIAMCDECVKQLSNYFPIKLNTETDLSISVTDIETDTANAIKEGHTSLGGVQNEKMKTLNGDTLLGKVAEVITGKVKASLPSAYQQCDLSQENISTMVRLCLADPTFPAFVSSVEQELNKITEESKLTQT